MARKKAQRRPKAEYAFPAVQVTRFDVRIGAGFSLQVLGEELNWCDPDTPVFEASRHLELTGVFLAPPDRKEHELRLHVYGERASAQRCRDRVVDYHVLDRHGNPKYRQRKGYQVPVYDLPNGMAVLSKRRGVPEWDMALFTDLSIVSDWLVMRGIEPLYLALHELKVDRRRWIRSVDLQTTDPMEE